MQLSEAINVLETAIGDPSEGLPEEVFLFLSRITPLVNVDLLIQNQRQETLLTWRDDGQNMVGWHVPGGIIRYKEEFHHRIKEVAHHELKAEVDLDDEPIALNRVILPRERRIRGHFVSLLYRCTLRTPLDPSLQFDEEMPLNGRWAWHFRCPENLLDVQQMYRKFFEN